jgi:hypothetical protein
MAQQCCIKVVRMTVIRVCALQEVRVVVVTGNAPEHVDTSGHQVRAEHSRASCRVEQLPFRGSLPRAECAFCLRVRVGRCGRTWPFA